MNSSVSNFLELYVQGCSPLICFNLTALVALDNIKHLLCVIYMGRENTIHTFSGQEQCSLHMTFNTVVSLNKCCF